MADELSSRSEDAFHTDTVAVASQQDSLPSCDTALQPSLVTAAFHMTHAQGKKERRKVLASLAPHLFSGARGSVDAKVVEAWAADNKVDRGYAVKMDSNDMNEHVTIWNRLERRKIAGNAAPLRRNVHAYLNKHKDCEVYKGQDLKPGQKPKKAIKKRERLKKHSHPIDLVTSQLQNRFQTPFSKLRESGVQLQGLKVTHVQEPGCKDCRVLFSHEEYCAPCHMLTRTVRKVCRSYSCRMKRVGVNGNLHPSLQGGFHEDLQLDLSFDVTRDDGLMKGLDEGQLSGLPSIPLEFDFNDVF